MEASFRRDRTLSRPDLLKLIEAAPVVLETYEGFHEEQLALLLSHCPPHTRLIATMLADTGMRHREELGAMTRS